MLLFMYYIQWVNLYEFKCLIEINITVAITILPCCFKNNYFHTIFFSFCWQGMVYDLKKNTYFVGYLFLIIKHWKLEWNYCHEKFDFIHFLNISMYVWGQKAVHILKEKILEKFKKRINTFQIYKYIYINASFLLFKIVSIIFGLVCLMFIHESYFHAGAVSDFYSEGSQLAS